MPRVPARSPGFCLCRFAPRCAPDSVHYTESARLLTALWWRGRQAGSPPPPFLAGPFVSDPSSFFMTFLIIAPIYPLCQHAPK